MGQRRLPLYLPADLYKKLADVAKAEDRDPLQQARVLLRQALEREGSATAQDAGK